MKDFAVTCVRPDPYSIIWTLTPIRPGGDSVNTMNTIAPMTRRERAEALADLYEVPLADLYRRYGAVLLSNRDRRDVTHETRGEVTRGR